jgi:hypothetical protein
MVNALPSSDKILGGHSDIAGDLPEEGRGNIAAAVIWDGCGTAIRVAELHVRSALTDASEAVPCQQGDHLSGLEHWKFGHLFNRHQLGADELSLKSWFSILKEHLDYFLEIAC